MFLIFLFCFEKICSDLKILIAVIAFMAFRGVMGTMEILRVMGFLGMVGNAKIAMGRGRLMLF